MSLVASTIVTHARCRHITSANAAPPAPHKASGSSRQHPRTTSQPQSRRAPVKQRSSGAPGSGSGWCSVDSAPAWRVFNVSVPADADPGKEDFSVHPQLLEALARKLDLAPDARLADEAVRVVRKSFDARKEGRDGARTRKYWAYCVDVDAAAIKAAGLKRLQERPNALERQQQLEQQPAAPAATSAHVPGGGQGSDQCSGDGSAQHPASVRDPVVVVGSGPAGLFAALELAEAGVKVILLERGQPVEVRGRDIGALFVRRQVSSESNLCYGEGGAGTWSDGKLTTRIGRNSDPVRRVLAALHRFGAPESVLVSGKPHLGTDRLVRILKAFREHLISLGCDVRFGCRVADLAVEGGRLVGVQLADGTTIRAARVVLAVGHSARDMYHSLRRWDVALTPKPFAVGFRIEHPQALIDRLQYGERDAGKVLRGKGPYPVAEYRLAAEIDAARASISAGDAAAHAASQAAAGAAGSGNPSVDGHQPPSAASRASEDGAGASGPSTRGVYSFCMCPGGQIVPTSTNEEELCINGMSFSRRDSKWANSALVATVQPDDWAHLVPRHGPLAGMALQQEFEREAARRGGGAFVAPAQRASDFLAAEAPSMSQAVPLPPSSYRLGIKAVPLHDFYPPHLTAAFRAALRRFDRAMPGFAGVEALLHAAETRTSAPVRIERHPATLESVTLPGLYPCGEGAGYAGGIMSAAVDGLRVGATLAAELTGRAALPDAAAYRVKAGY